MRGNTPGPELVTALDLLAGRPFEADVEQSAEAAALLLHLVNRRDGIVGRTDDGESTLNQILNAAGFGIRFATECLLEISLCYVLKTRRHVADRLFAGLRNVDRHHQAPIFPRDRRT